MNTIKTITLESKTIENANPVSSKLLKTAQSEMGMIPNMYSGMANNSALLEGYISAYKAFRMHSGFTSQEQEVVFLSVAYENNCEYCMAAHSFVADQWSKVPEEITNAIRTNSEILDEKLKALSLFSRQMTAKRGLPSKEDVENFLSVGYTEESILGVISGIGVKTMSNYFNHIYQTPVDEDFQSRAWSKA